jgi:hypothetical protein
MNYLLRFYDGSLLSEILVEMESNSPFMGFNVGDYISKAGMLSDATICEGLSLDDKLIVSEIGHMITNLKNIKTHCLMIALKVVRSG